MNRKSEQCKRCGTAGMRLRAVRRWFGGSVVLAQWCVGPVAQWCEGGVAGRLTRMEQDGEAANQTQQIARQTPKSNCTARQAKLRSTVVQGTEITGGYNVPSIGSYVMGDIPDTFKIKIQFIEKRLHQK